MNNEQPMTDEQAKANLEKIAKLFNEDTDNIDNAKFWTLLLQLRSYSDTKGRVIPVDIFSAMNNDMRMICFDGFLACMAACMNLNLPDKRN